MAERTGISWADATLNFWIGCTKVSPACDHCYAELWGKRFGVKWGPGEVRRATKHILRKARALQRLAVAKRDAGGGAFLCFSNSLSDFFDKEIPLSLLAAAFEAMRAAPDVTFLLLTKRPGLIVKRSRAAAELSLGVYASDDDGLRSWWPRNAVPLCTVVNQPEANSEIPKLLAAKAVLRPAFVGVSMEPLLGPVDLTRLDTMAFRGAEVVNALTGEAEGMFGDPAPRVPKLDWVITGGESGTQARPSNPQWFRDLRDQCAGAGVPFHFKQWGEWVSVSEVEGPGRHYAFPDSRTVRRTGKKISGRTLDHVTHDARPEVRA